MAIVNMNKLSLIGLKSDKEKILETFMKMGVVEVTDLKEEMSSEEWGKLVSNEDNAREISELNSKLDKISASIEYLSKFDKRKKGLFSSKRKVSIDDYNTVVKNQDKLWKVIDDISEYDKKLSNLKSEINKNTNLILNLKPWEKLDILLDMAGTKETTVLTGVVPEIVNTDRLGEELSNEVPESYFEVVSKDREQSYLLVIYLNSKAEDVMRVLKQYGFSKSSLEKFSGTSNENIKSLSKSIKDLENEISSIEEKISSFADYQGDLEILHDYILVERDRKKAAGITLNTNDSFFLQGWVPETSANQVKEVIEKKFDCFLEITEAGEDEDFPILLVNKDFASSVESITEMYSLPNRNEVDPNAITAPFFVLFFGLMLGDGGYGLIMAAVSIFVLLKFKLEEDTKKFMKLMMYCGFATMLWGALLGGWFGIEALGKTALWFNLTDEPQKMLSFSLLFGVIHIYAGLGVKAYNLYRQKKYLDIIFDVFFWYVMFTGFALFLLPYIPIVDKEAVTGLVRLGKYLLVIGAVLLILTQGRHNKNIIGKIIGGVSSLYDLIGFLSDLLSYSRLLALGLASSVIAAIVNQLALMMGFSNILKVVFVVAVLIFGHLFNFAINALGAYVHSSRLQYIEFFGKFYEGGGTAFEPLKVNTKYINLKY
ncbi:MAG TPA: V-type ATP synthase subunit I [Acetivibrio saccincola]|jgi:V/A-type H+-transporting ATPase subunit I|uniref:V-type ATP synthase subunit I n=2 Tax=Acetivibrio saccincola TaxID=1677857 RepID=UPI000ADA59D6|nr:V-type ATP synthase subunit I [Acetivibrio saccincola]NLW26107.1 V-type ATP synthase subunit I [Acetivibrio saccincola]HOA97362.1 V-type ATP synthase subunit I [Acetivibrio saccincola]HQD28110.1 V-type ATP synthase subunit I [Acetivibrio saccincola]